MKTGAVADTHNPNSEKRSMKTGPWRSLISQTRCISELWVQWKSQSFKVESNRRKTISATSNMHKYTGKHTHIHWQVHVHLTQSKPVCWWPWVPREIWNTQWITAKKLDVISCIVSVSNMGHARQPPSSPCSSISLWGLSWPFILILWLTGFLCPPSLLYFPHSNDTPHHLTFSMCPFALSLLPMSSLLAKDASLYGLLRNLFSSARSVWNFIVF